MVANDIEIALTVGYQSKFNVRRYFVVPNVYWGIGLSHEADLLAISSSKYAHEIEIKVSVSDMKADLRKHKHSVQSFKIRALWYAMPVSIYDKVKETIPEKAGIITIDDNTRMSEVIRKPKINTSAKKISDRDYLKLGHLMTMRYWNLKETVFRYHRGKQ
jgi:hypothetical protein